MTLVGVGHLECGPTYLQFRSVAASVAATCGSVSDLIVNCSLGLYPYAQSR